MVKMGEWRAEREVARLGPGAEGPVPGGEVSENLEGQRVSILEKVVRRVHTRYGRRVYEGYVTGGSRGDVGWGFRELG